MKHSGRKVVLAIGLIALVLGGTGWFYRYHTTHRAAQFWGSTAAMLIRGPSSVVVFELKPIEENSKKSSDLPIKAADYFRRRSQDISDARGLVHLRNALSLDRNFDWEASDSHSEENWVLGIAFSEGEDQQTILFSVDFLQMARVVPGEDQSQVPELRRISCAPMARSLTTYFESLGIELSQDR